MHRSIRSASPIRAIIWRWRWVFAALFAAVTIQAVLGTLGTIYPTNAFVVVASEDLQTGDEITASNVHIERMPQGVVPVSSLTSIDDAVGETLAAPLPRGGIVVKAQLFSSAFASSPPDGSVVTSVTLDDPTMATLVQPGDMIQLYAPPENGSSSGRATLLTSQALVMANQNKAEKSGLLSEADYSGKIYVAIPRNDATLIIGSGINSPLHAVIISP